MDPHWFQEAVWDPMSPDELVEDWHCRLSEAISEIAPKCLLCQTGFVEYHGAKEEETRVKMAREMVALSLTLSLTI